MGKVRLAGTRGEVKLAYLVEDVDRHGNVRLYVRRKGLGKVRLREPPGTPAFFDEYRKAVAGEAPPKRTSAETIQPGSLRWLCVEYFKSADYKRLDASTRQARRNILEAVCRKAGALPFAKLESRHIRKWRDGRAETPESANALVKALRRVLAWAIEAQLHDRNPARDVPLLRTGSTGFHTWTVEEVRQYEARHPVGTKARLALALLLFTGQRRSDIIRLGRQHARDGWLHFTQHKNRNRKPKRLSIPILPELQTVLDASPCGDLTYLVTEYGQAFTDAGFGNKFRNWCDQAALYHCTAHGIRKAGATIAAENGATERELMAIFGWDTSQQATGYTKAADQKKLAGRAMSLLIPGETENKSAPLSEPVGNGGTDQPSKPLRNKEAG